METAPLPSKVVGYDLYIDGFQALRRPEILQGSNITHVVSVLDWKFASNWAPLRGFQHLHIPLDDVYDSNILSYFPRSNAFIHTALQHSKPRQLTTDPLSQDASPPALPSGVLVHCAMGVSRSTTIVLAYLLWSSRQPDAISPPNPETQSSTSSTSTPEMVSLPRTPLTVDTALSLVRKSRPQVEPNSGFIKQLRMYEAMNCPTTQEELESHKIYRRWLNSREVMDALSDNRAPTMQHISFRDEENDDDEDVASKNSSRTGSSRSSARMTDAVAPLDLSNPEDDSPTEITNPDITLSSPSPAPSAPANLEIKCRKCRRLLAKSTFILPHKPPPHRDPSAGVDGGGGSDPCAHIFLHPLSWMRPTLSQGELDGRLTCPTTWCGANVGKFAWQGLRCSCGGWVTPGFGLAKGKVDEVRVLPNGSHSRSRSALEAADDASVGGTRHAWSSAVRLPPGMRKGGSNNGNL